MPSGLDQGQARQPGTARRWPRTPAGSDAPSGWMIERRLSVGNLVDLDAELPSCPVVSHGDKDEVRVSVEGPEGVVPHSQLITEVREVRVCGPVPQVLRNIVRAHAVQLFCATAWHAHAAAPIIFMK